MMEEVPFDPTWNAVAAVMNERARQDRLKAEGRFEFTCADDGMPLLGALAALGEEYGEVCTEALASQRLVTDGEGTPQALRKELVQVAAVAVAWVEKLDRHLAE